MVVMTSASHCKIPGSIRWKSQIFFSLLATKLAGKNDGGEGSLGCVQVTLADSCRMRGMLGHGGEKIMLLVDAVK